MRNPVAIISRYWRIILLIIVLILLVIHAWMRDPYPALSMAGVEERQKAFNAALASNLRMAPTEDVLAFIPEEKAKDLLSRVSSKERSRIGTSSCGWVTRECLTYNRRRAHNACESYPDDTRIGDIVCRASIPSDRQTFLIYWKGSGRVMAIEGCLFTTWTRKASGWRVRNAQIDFPVDHVALERARREMTGQDTCSDPLGCVDPHIFDKLSDSDPPSNCP